MKKSKLNNKCMRKVRKTFGTRPMFGTSLYDGTYANELSCNGLMKGSYESTEAPSMFTDPKSLLVDASSTADEVEGESAE